MPSLSGPLIPASRKAPPLDHLRDTDLRDSPKACRILRTYRADAPEARIWRDDENAPLS